jgi:polysaccharide pyruvyl transferase WcaK-like protein/glycosyltransferase involved in cell wall biosynthesis
MRVRWSDGELPLSLAVPLEFSASRFDASPFLCACLLLAMRLGEDLDVRGPVSDPLLERGPRIVDLYARWDPRLYRSRVIAGDELAPAPRAAGIGCFLSRGVDSLYSASAPRGSPGPLTHLIFCDRLQPRYSPEVRAEEIRLAREAASRLGLPLVVVETNLRRLTDPIVGDWLDMAGAGLAFLATGMAGGLGHVVIPSSDGPGSVGPCGTSPLLDPLFSTAEVDIEYDTPKTRVTKVGWLARERPDLLPYLKVCFYENRPDNCCRCSKCLLTLVALEAAGVRAQATGFRSGPDPDAFAEHDVFEVEGRIEWTQAEQALLARGGRDDLVAAVRELLERADALDPAAMPLPDNTPAFRARASREWLLLPPPGTGPSGGSAPSSRRTGRARPRATVMMPACDAGDTLRNAAASALAQTVGDLELIVVDEGASVPVVDVLGDLRADPRVRIVRHSRNRGPSAARNTALAMARAPLVSQLDADDLWEPDYLESVLPCFDDPAVGLAYSNCTILDHPEGRQDFVGDPSVHPVHLFPKIAERNPVPSSTVTMRTAAVRAVGGYARWLRRDEDHHLYMKLVLAGWRFAYLHRRLARYRWPQSRLGAGYDARSHELWQLAMFGSFVARHPRTPGPRRKVRNQVRRELEWARAIRRMRLPPAEDDRPRILIEPGNHDLSNLGDIAMLQICVERLTRLLPGASIGVLTTTPDRLARHCPGASAIPALGRHAWFGAPWEGGAYGPLLSESRRARIRRLSRLATSAGPRAARAALRTELLARQPAGEEVRGFVGALLAAEAVVVSGRGGTTDVFLDDNLQLLELLRVSSALGIPTAMFGQGLGPVHDTTLRARAAQVLPKLELIAVRERLAGIPLLRGFGVAPERIVFTGDDALELAHRLRSDRPARSGIGVGLRVAPFSGVGDAALDALGQALRDSAARQQSDLVPVPISLNPLYADTLALTRLIDGLAGDVDTPRAAIERVGACRVVVTGSYHAAVFALAQGVPVVALSASSYYEAKFGGLADLFPGGCRVIALSGPGVRERVRTAVDEAWAAAEMLRPQLLAASERQIAAAGAAYARFATSVSSRATQHPRRDTERNLAEAVIAQPAGTATVSHSSRSSESASRYL